MKDYATLQAREGKVIVTGIYPAKKLAGHDVVTYKPLDPEQAELLRSRLSSPITETSDPRRIPNPDFRKRAFEVLLGLSVGRSSARVPQGHGLKKWNIHSYGEFPEGTVFAENSGR